MRTVLNIISLFFGVIIFQFEIIAQTTQQKNSKMLEVEKKGFVIHETKLERPSGYQIYGERYIPQPYRACFSISAQYGALLPRAEYISRDVSVRVPGVSSNYENKLFWDNSLRELDMLYVLGYRYRYFSLRPKN